MKTPNNLYKLPSLKPLPKLKRPSFSLGKGFWFLVLVIFLSSFFGFAGGLVSGAYFSSQFSDYLAQLDNFLGFKPPQQKIIEKKETAYLPQTTEEEKVIRAVRELSPAVVSIIVSKDVPVFEEYFYNPFEEFRQFFGEPFFDFKIPQYRQKGTEKREIGGGTGFVISSDGLVLTNAHVVSDNKAEYTVLTNEGKKYSAKVLARDSFRDIALLKIGRQVKLPTLKLGNSDELQIGQTVIAIGNALGEFRNTVSVGVISGLGRRVTAGGGGTLETLENVIQTDAAINRGNSGGPLLNLKGEVIGINFAMAQGAENIGFAIPINAAKRDIEQVERFGKITLPFLGVRYVLINKIIQKENNLPVDYGAWVIKGEEGEPAVVPGSAAEKAGIKEKDIILEINGEKITQDKSLAQIVMKYFPGDKLTLKILRGEREETIEAVLGERKD